MKVKEITQKLIDEEYSIVCKCGRKGNLELCGDFEVVRIEIDHEQVVIRINKSLEEIYAYRAKKDISGVLTYGCFLQSDVRNYLTRILEVLKEVGK